MLTDEQLLLQYRQGNTAVLELLVYRYHRPIYAYLYRLTNSRQLAEDFVQETFTRVFAALQAGKQPTRFRPWMYKIAGNLCRDWWKSGTYRYEVAAQQEGLEAAASEQRDGVASMLDKQQEREAVLTALNALPDDERHIVILRFYQELKLDEIAELLEQPPGTVRSRLYRAFRRLATTLREGEGQNGGQIRQRKG